jgi:hypothetical protein
MTLSRTFFAITCAVVFHLPAACTVIQVDDDDGTSTAGAGGSVGDGKLHPEPNGVRISEMEACTKLKNALQARATKLQNKCPATTLPICPNFLRRLFDPDCMQYDAGSVDGCLSFYGEILECADLNGEGCVVTPYPGSEPAGCE